MRGLLILFVLLLKPDAALACGRAELRRFIEGAQQLNERTEQLGARLLSCPGETAEAAHWIAFYRAVKMPAPPPAAPVRPAAAQANIQGEVGRAITAAYGGSYSALRAKLDAGEPLYRDVPEAALAVGRMLVRERRFAEGRRYYEDFLRIRDSAAEEAEYIFTFIWEGDLERAQRELNSARGDAYLMASVARGQTLVAELKGKKPAAPKGGGQPPARREARLAAGAETFVIKDQLRRYSSLVRYRGIVDASWQHHLLLTQVYDAPTLNTDQLRLGREQPLGDYFTVAAHAAYVVHASKHWGGEASARFRIPSSVMAAVGVERRHLYPSLPLPKTSLGLTQDTQWAELGWDERIVVKTARRTDAQGSPFEEHELNVRQPVSAETAVLAMAGYGARAVPSPHYETFRKSQRLGIGGLLRRDLDERWGSELEAMYVLRVRQPYGDAKYLRHSGLELKAGFGSPVGESLRFAGQVTYAAEETERPSGKVEHRLGVVAALELLD